MRRDGTMDFGAPAFIGDVAISKDGHLLYAAALHRDSIFVVNLSSGVAIEEWKTLARPYKIQMHPSGRIFYVSDFDPAGQSMPVGVARKVEYFLQEGRCNGADIKLFPVVLTIDQIRRYRLPRTPIKETEKRAGKFEDRYGAGAVELDALEALHPGTLATILTSEIGRYYDRALDRRT